MPDTYYDAYICFCFHCKHHNERKSSRLLFFFTHLRFNGMDVWMYSWWWYVKEEKRMVKPGKREPTLSSMKWKYKFFVENMKLFWRCKWNIRKKLYLPNTYIHKMRSARCRRISPLFARSKCICKVLKARFLTMAIYINLILKIVKFACFATLMGRKTHFVKMKYARRIIHTDPKKSTEYNDTVNALRIPRRTTVIA